MKVAFEEGNMQFCEVVDIYMAKKYDEILMASNANQWVLYKSIADYLHKMHINIICHLKMI